MLQHGHTGAKWADGTSGTQAQLEEAQSRCARQRQEGNCRTCWYVGTRTRNHTRMNGHTCTRHAQSVKQYDYLPHKPQEQRCNSKKKIVGPVCMLVKDSMHMHMTYAADYQTTSKAVTRTDSRKRVIGSQAFFSSFFFFFLSASVFCFVCLFFFSNRVLVCLLQISRRIWA